MTDEQQEQRGWMDEEQVERAIVLQVAQGSHEDRRAGVLVEDLRAEGNLDSR